MRSHGAPSEGDGQAEGWTKQDLMAAGDLSAKTFDLIRKAARVRGPSHGGLAWVFSAADVGALVQTRGERVVHGTRAGWRPRRGGNCSRRVEWRSRSRGS